MGSGYFALISGAEGYQLSRKYWAFEMNFFTKHLLYSFLLDTALREKLTLSGNWSWLENHKFCWKLIFEFSDDSFPKNLKQRKKIDFTIISNRFGVFKIRKWNCWNFASDKP
jgi:hypothetical protein